MMKKKEKQRNCLLKLKLKADVAVVADVEAMIVMQAVEMQVVARDVVQVVAAVVSAAVVDSGQVAVVAEGDNTRFYDGILSQLSHWAIFKFSNINYEHSNNKCTGYK